MDKGVQKEVVRKDVHKKIMGSCNRGEGRVYAKKRKSIPFVKRRERGGQRIHEGVIEEGVYPAIKVTTNGAGILCREEKWEEEDGTGLSVS